jgi:hypothetical protein
VELRVRRVAAFFVVVVGIAVGGGGGGCRKAKSGVPAAGTAPVREDVLGSWKVVGMGAASTLVLSDDGTFTNTPISKLDAPASGTWTLDDGGELRLSITNAKGKTYTNAASLKWDAGGVMLMSTRDFPKPMRMTRGDEWPKEVYENVKK